METKTTFSKRLLMKLPGLKWIGPTAFKQMRNGNVAKIWIDDLGIQGHYNGFHVHVINKQEGKVDGCFFSFDEVMEVIPNERYTSKLHAWSDNTKGFDWYILRPKDESAMAKAIGDYIKLLDQ